VKSESVFGVFVLIACGQRILCCRYSLFSLILTGYTLPRELVHQIQVQRLLLQLALDLAHLALERRRQKALRVPHRILDDPRSLLHQPRNFPEPALCAVQPRLLLLPRELPSGAGNSYGSTTKQLGVDTSVASNTALQMTLVDCCSIFVWLSPILIICAPRSPSRPS